MTPVQSADEELLRQWRDSPAEEERRRLLEQLLGAYLGRIARWALRSCRDPEEAREVAQDALLAVCSHLGQFRGESRFSTWVYTIVRNHAQNRASRKSGRLEITGDVLPELAAPDADPASAVEQARQAEEVRRLIQSELTPLEARIFLLHFGKDVPLRVLNRELGLTNRSGARAYLVSAKRKLRRKFRGRRAGWTDGRVASQQESWSPPARGKRERT